MAGSVFDDGAGRAPGFGPLPGGVDRMDVTGAVGDRVDHECRFDDVEVVDEFGLPVLPPDHSEAELAAILATCPLDDPELVDAAAEYVSRGPDGAVGVVVDPSPRRLEQVGRRVPDLALVGTLQDLTGLEAPFGAGLEESFGGDAGDAAGIDGAVARALGALADGELRAVVAGWERVVSWVRAAQARVAAELMARAGGPLGRDSVAGELAAQLHVTSAEGWRIAMRGEGIVRYPRLADALAAGKVDAKKADTFLRAATGLTPEERGEAIDDLLPEAPRRTWKWVSERMNARAAELHGKKARRGDAMTRCNVWVEQAGPGMGRLVADLPVIEAARAFNTVQAAAKALKDTPGETRPLGALRAAALTALVTGDLVLPATDHTRDTDTDDAIDGAGDVAGDVVEPPWLVEPVLDTDLVPIPADPHGLVLTAPAPASAPVGDRHAAGAVVEPGTRIRVVEVTATVNVTVPARMLLDRADMTPGILDGIGPIPAEDAARIAADGTWRRLLTDPVSGVLTDYSTRTYTPGSILRAAVSTRDRACRFPGCDRPALTAGKAMLDLDHIEPFDPEHRYQPGEPGQTRAANLHALCRRHHNLKTHAKWQVTRDPDTGATRWTPPTGVVALVDPAIIDPVIRYGLTHGMTLAEPPRPPATRPGSGPDAPGPSRPGPPPF